MIEEDTAGFICISLKSHNYDDKKSEHAQANCDQDAESNLRKRRSLPKFMAAFSTGIEHRSRGTVEYRIGQPNQDKTTGRIHGVFTPF